MRKAFKMKIYDGMAEEYKKRHDMIWEDMIDLIHNYGGKDYSIFLDEDTNTLFGVIDIEDEEFWARTATTEINKKWWDYMADIMETNPDNSPISTDLTEVFYLK